MQNKAKQEELRHSLRLLKLLSKRFKTGLEYRMEEDVAIIVLNENQYRFSYDLIRKLCDKKYLVTFPNVIKITDSGTAYLKKQLNPDSLLASADNHIAETTIIHDRQYHQVQMNMNESPLLRLFSRKTKNGTSYITMEEFQAGERLRQDFERGQLQPKITASLQGSMGSAGRAGRSSVEEITDFALDARKRVGKAIENLGPELSGVTLDICCFLKGLESVERERAWPPRSAKLMLKTALALLARHYGISGYENQRTNKHTSWGGADYRPTINRT